MEAHIRLVHDCDPSENATYPPINPTKVKYVEIFPPVGIARLGDSPEYFLAPEVPRRTTPPTNVENFRDSHRKMRRQGVRFRVYAYDDENNLLGEVNEKINGYKLNWKLHVANKKASFTIFQGRFTRPRKEELRNPGVQSEASPDQRNLLIVDPGVKEINNSTTAADFISGFCGSNPSNPRRVTIGHAQRDSAGRLIFIAGDGNSCCVTQDSQIHPEIISQFDSTDWVDNVCDGWVSVEVLNLAWTLPKSGRKATVISAPPKFSWGIYNPTSLYDTMEDIYHSFNKSSVDSTVDFNKHIRPVLLSPCSMSWVNNIALKGHGTYGKGDFLSLIKNTKTREEAQVLTNRIFDSLRKPYDNEHPDYSQSLTKYMPHLSGDKGDIMEPGTIYTNQRQIDPGYFASLTKLQYNRFKIWKDHFIFPFPEDEMYPPSIEELPIDKQPEYLTRASLEAAIGDPLYPGIEVYWIAKELDTYDLNVGDKPIYPAFRIDHEKLLPGHLTRGLSLPWQCDFDLCNTHWWPSSRPDVVVTTETFKEVMEGEGTTGEKFARAMTKRKKWSRGLRESVNTTYPGSTDMIRYWNRLGIVRRFPGNSESPVYLEDERREIPQQKKHPR